ncbi:uncharacterized protein K452DRAFT_341160 [Aplosporella prunicola CBS 121167]|uniref:Uncharacterized protein n=1 Tax=Aplosporella prunicola CBS 121167 TaxID=1176127 RepID=A0A6A6B207_9PEZI|nr:uncharacterized protein K452DRAFT_341160 [Aplosporella prunicola CBS 121167]KAF2137403.1 hypothetical protein K452DRAFT_341160 [Aplosporella prunicola CBS 121167]
MAPTLQDPDGVDMVQQPPISFRPSRESGRDRLSFELGILDTAGRSSSQLLNDDVSRDNAQHAFTEAPEPVAEPLIHESSASSNAAVESDHKASQAPKLGLVAPISMAVAFVAGIAFSAGHHFYYSWLDGQVVGSTDTQQYSLRFGNAFVFLAKCCFCASANVAFTQWLWRALRQKYISTKGLDAAFSANETLLSFFDLDMLSKVKIGAILAAATWCIPLIALVTPATLSGFVVAPVPMPLFPQYLPLNSTGFNGLDSSPQLLRWTTMQRIAALMLAEQYITDISPRFGKLILSTATTGQQFAISQPFSNANSNYLVDFYAPRIKCDKSSADVAYNMTVAAARYQPGSGYGYYNTSKMNFTKLEYFQSDFGYYRQIGYFAIIPFRDVFNVNKISNTKEEGLWIKTSNIKEEEFGFNSGESNELNIVIRDHDPDTNATVPKFITCQLWNASWTVNITFRDNVQNVQVMGVELLNRTTLQLRSWDPSLPSSLGYNMNQALYTAYFLGIAKNLLGYIIGIMSPPRGTFLSYGSDIQKTVLAGSTEYVAMMRNKGDEWNVSLQESHKPLAAMIEEFSQNVTLNMMADNYFRYV